MLLGLQRQGISNPIRLISQLSLIVTQFWMQRDRSLSWSEGEACKGETRQNTQALLHRGPVKDTLLWSVHFEPSNTQNNLWIRMVKSVFRNSTDGLSVYAAWLKRAVYVLLGLKDTSIRRPVHPIFPIDSPQCCLQALSRWVIQTRLLRERLRHSTGAR